MKTKVGIALGGGGVRGMAHVPALETIDACGVTPVALAGTSMGAIIGALYASGKSGNEIRKIIIEHGISRKDGFGDICRKRNALVKWLNAVNISWHGTGLLKADGFLRHLTAEIEAETFEELAIPMHIVATDFHSGEAGCDGADAVFRTGSDPLRIDVCNSHRLIVLHELARAWDHANLNQEKREAFMVMRGFDVWNDHDVPWKERAVEHLAEILVWGLHERGIPDAINQAAFYFATETQPSWLSS